MKKNKNIFLLIYLTLLFFLFLMIWQRPLMVLAWIQNPSQILNYIIGFILFFGFVSFFYWNYIRKIKKTLPYKIYETIKEPTTKIPNHITVSLNLIYVFYYY